MLKAFRDEGLRVGLYHSLIDWHHPQNVIDSVLGPYRAHPDREKMNKARDQAKYAKYLHGQVRELLTQFGKIDVLWMDFSYKNKKTGDGKGKEDWQSEKLYKLVRQLMPKVILNDRLDLDGGWDIKTPEQYQPREWVRVDGQPVVWEACQTFSGSWGYHRDETSWKSLDQLVQMLIDTVSKGGNLLLNVGPTGRGEFDERALNRLSGLGEWMKRHSRSIYGCTQAPEGFKAPIDCRLTYNPDTKRMYVHSFAWPYVYLHLDGFAGKVKYAQLLNDASEVKMRENFTGLHGAHEGGKQGTLTLELPVQKPNVTVPVIELFMK
jgi:alpha-L-fucosidase